MPGAGHFGPLSVFLNAWKADADVVLAASESLRVTAAELGLGFRALPDPPAEQLGRSFSRVASMSHEDANAHVVQDVFARLRAGAAIGELGELIDEFEPDLIAYESAAFAGPLAAASAGVTAVRVAIGVQESERLILELAEPAVSEIGASLGLTDGAARQALLDPRWVGLFPRSLDEHRNGSPVDGLRFRDPSWEREPSASATGDPHIYVTFGSVAGALPHVAGVFSAALEALAGMDVSATITTGRDFDHAQLGSVPPNVTVEPWLDQRVVLGRSAAVICHGGGGSLLGALIAGCPVVAVPLFSLDQYVNARHVEASGAGLAAQPNAASIRAALTKVRETPRYRERAQAMAREIAALPSARDALTAVTSS